MNETRLEELLLAYEDNTLRPDELTEFKHFLRSSPAARERLVEAGVLQSVAKSHFFIEVAAAQLPTKPNRLFQWRPLIAAAAGIVLGMFCTSVVFGYVGPRVAEKVKAVFSEGFESGMTKTAPGVPRVAGHWSGDEAEVVISTPQAKAHGGGKMLRFFSATYPGENSPRSQWGDVYRIVDVRGLADAGYTVARVSANFAQGAATAEERFVCRVGAFALDQELNTLPSPLSHSWLQQNNSATGSRRAMLTGAGRWQEVTVEVPITRETRFVVLHLAVVQEQPTLTSGIVQFPAHFMDDVKVELITRP